MSVSAEVRWFWRGSLPRDLEQWFMEREIAPGGGVPRVDEYLVDARQRVLGIKRRGSHDDASDGIEVKALVEVREAITQLQSARVQIWTKATSFALRIDDLPRIRVQKTRRLRKFDTGESSVAELALDANEQLTDRTAALPVRGCHLELVALDAGESREVWSSLAFEAFGPLASLEDSLARTLAALQPIDVAVLASGLELSYPEWLATQVRK